MKKLFQSDPAGNLFDDIIYLFFSSSVCSYPCVNVIVNGRGLCYILINRNVAKILIRKFTPFNELYLKMLNLSKKINEL